MQRPMTQDHLKMAQKLQIKVAQAINWQNRDIIAQENRSALSLLTFDYVRKNKGSPFANKVRQAIENFDLEVSGITQDAQETDANGHDVHAVNLRIGDIHAEVQFRYGQLDG
ncbi:hypothetical protein [Vibrio alfacsensis]|uniref:hypothetical protein n=1 Tax=Vibrio alfacsensis TaxID=1074311 RepID=UPI001BEEEA7E|nr:hypothetical protein [Vibrio alfacsensis]BCN26786.1 hypothetical protein VYA_39780 [Vibrio alfacsensis]